MEHLIESVRKYPCLWQVDLSEYKDNELKEAAWREVFNECDFSSVQEVKALWKKLRDGHRQAMNNKKKMSTGQAAEVKSKWRYEDQMEFLLPNMRNRTQHTNIQAASPTLEQEDLSSTESSSGIQTKKNKTIHSILEEEQKRREKRAAERMHFRNQILENASQSTRINRTSALDKFFLCMSETTSELPEFMQMRVQRQIFNIVLEAKEQYLIQPNSSLESSQTESSVERGGGTIVNRFSGGIPFQLQGTGTNSYNSSRTNSAQLYHLSPEYDIISPAPAPPESMASPTQDSSPDLDLRSFINNYDFRQGS